MIIKVILRWLCNIHDYTKICGIKSFYKKILPTLKCAKKCEIISVLSIFCLATYTKTVKVTHLPYVLNSILNIF